MKREIVLMSVLKDVYLMNENMTAFLKTSDKQD